MSLTPTRIIIDGPATGAWNMSVDQAILESVDEIGLPTFRIYYWQPATLSLGYFQKVDDRQLHVESNKCDVVRRASGGGAIIHDQEITYSFVIPSANRWASRNTEIYKHAHDAITTVFAKYGVDVHAFNNEVDPPPESPNDFLCFNRRSNGDLVFEGFKIVGSAQRRAKKAVLQHGSIILETSKFAPQLPGVFSLTDRRFERDQFVGQMIDEFCKRLNLEPIEHQLSGIEQKLAAQIDEQKFNNDDWTVNRFRSNV